MARGNWGGGIPSRNHQLAARLLDLSAPVVYPCGMHLGRVFTLEKEIRADVVEVGSDPDRLRCFKLNEFWEDARFLNIPHMYEIIDGQYENWTH